MGHWRKIKWGKKITVELLDEDNTVQQEVIFKMDIHNKNFITNNQPSVKSLQKEIENNISVSVPS